MAERHIRIEEKKAASRGRRGEGQREGEEGRGQVKVCHTLHKGTADFRKLQADDVLEALDGWIGLINAVISQDGTVAAAVNTWNQRITTQINNQKFIEFILYSNDINTKFYINYIVSYYIT